jgi:hypothetical protein
MRAGVVNRSEMVRDLKNLEVKVLRSALRKAVTAGSKVFYQEILNKTPVRTGRLKAHIERRTLRGRNAFGREVEGQAGLFLSRGGKDEPFYGVIIDRGYRVTATNRYNPRAKRRLKTTTPGPQAVPKSQRKVIRSVAARPFITGSFVTVKDKAVEVTGEKITADLVKAWVALGK